jgi:hypothetical protein
LQNKSGVWWPLTEAASGTEISVVLMGELQTRVDDPTDWTAESKVHPQNGLHGYVSDLCEPIASRLAKLC